MMQKTAISVAIASVVFFVLMTGIDLISGDGGITSETLMANVFRTLIFAMAFAAFQVAMIIFRDKSE